MLTILWRSGWGKEPEYRPDHSTDDAATTNRSWIGLTAPLPTQHRSALIWYVPEGGRSNSMFHAPFYKREAALSDWALIIE
ncbi:MAG: hypothetical protein MI924_33605, partial [Chloroflexales bacterium]|nr:hypothetical protein [Chloroflexales bacterium]